MKRLFVLALVAFFVSACGSLGLKPIEKMTDEELTTHMLRESGSDLSFSQLQNQLKATKNQLAMTGSKDQEKAKITEMVVDSMIEAFSYDNLYQPVYKVLHSKMKKSEKVGVIEFYRSEFGRKVLRLELMSQSPEGQAYFQQWLENINNGTVQLDKNKVAFSQELTELTKAVDLSVETVSAMSVGMMVGMNTTLPKDKQVKRTEMDLKIDQVKKQMEETMEPVVLMTMYFAYQSLTPEEQQKYLSFLRKGSGKKFVSLYSKAFLKTFKLAAHRVGKSLGRQLASMKKQAQNDLRIFAPCSDLKSA